MTEIVGRDEELASLEALFSGSLPAALVIDGEPGIGKTTLWRFGLEQASARGYRVLSTRPGEAQTHVAYAAIADFLGDMIEESLAALSPPQRQALETALALRSNRSPDRTAAAFGFFRALQGLVHVEPTLVAIDDAQWLDRPSAALLDFALRRIQDERLAVVATVRAYPEAAAFSVDEALGHQRVRHVSMGPLSHGALARVLRIHLDAVFPRPTFHRVYEASGGNPLLALEIAQALLREPALEPGQPLPVPHDLQGLLDRRLAALPAPTRRALWVAASLSEARFDLIEAATGAGWQDIEPAVEARLVELDGVRIRFAHPLMASHLAASGGPKERRKLHGQLAKIVTSDEDRARHLALAADGPDPIAAEALERAASHARARGAPAAAAELLEQAVQIGGADHPSRSRRIVQAALDWIEAGDLERTQAPLEGLVQTLPPGRDRAAALWLLATVEGEHVRAAESERLLVMALAESDEDLALSARINVDLAHMAIFAGTLPTGLRHARYGAELAQSVGEDDLLAEALAVFALTHFVAGEPFDTGVLDRALELERLGRSIRLDRSPSMVRGIILLRTGHLAAAREAFQKVRKAALERGDESSAASPDFSLGLLEVMAGNWVRTTAKASEVEASAEETKVKSAERTYVRALADAHLGRIDEARHAAFELVAGAEPTGEPFLALRYLALLGFVELSAGEPAAAAEVLERATVLAERMGLREPAFRLFAADYVEALLALGRVEEASALVEQFEQDAARLARPVALAAAGRCRGLIAIARGDLELGLSALESAAAASERLELPFERARTQLALGTARRRAKQRRQAREALELARSCFATLGAPLWAARAEAELARIGGRTASRFELTPTEERVASLVAEGKTNREVAAELVVSVRAVEANLSRIYQKLQVRSRAELAHSYRAQ